MITVRIFGTNKQSIIPVTKELRTLVKRCCSETLFEEGYKGDFEVSVTFVDNEGIRAINKEYRDIDSETDVLSFPCVDYESPSDFSLVKQDPVSYIDQESGELMLGDIMINAERVIAQAGQYGHSIKREYAFLITHSMLHLFGYDHENKEDETVMFEKQDRILDILGIFR